VLLNPPFSGRYCARASDAADMMSADAASER
jgi:hypothetical protein